MDYNCIQYSTCLAFLKPWGSISRTTHTYFKNKKMKINKKQSKNSKIIRHSGNLVVLILVRQDLNKNQPKTQSTLFHCCQATDLLIFFLFLKSQMSIILHRCTWQHKQIPEPWLSLSPGQLFNSATLLLCDLKDTWLAGCNDTKGKSRFEYEGNKGYSYAHPAPWLFCFICKREVIKLICGQISLLYSCF